MNSFKPNRIIRAVVLSIGLAASLPALAGSSNGYPAAYDNTAYSKSGFHDFAKVTAVEPVYQTISRQVPVEQCWNEEIAVDRRHSKSATPVLFGALLGGALGNELGHHKRNQQVGTVVGALIGGSIGRDIQNRHHAGHHSSHPVSYETRRHCETSYQTETEQELVGYLVDYKYRGHHYQTRLPEDPGKRLRVHVAISPAQ